MLHMSSTFGNLPGLLEQAYQPYFPPISAVIYCTCYVHVYPMVLGICSAGCSFRSRLQPRPQLETTS